jgi:hypothetical protein
MISSKTEVRCCKANARRGVEFRRQPFNAPSSCTPSTVSKRRDFPYRFYASDPNALNYFAGNVGIGTTSPDMLLSVGSNSPSIQYP